LGGSVHLVSGMRYCRDEHDWPSDHSMPAFKKLYGCQG
jgi:hypothetical protein